MAAQKLRNLRIAVYSMLLFTAAAVFLFSDRLWGAVDLGTLPIWAPLVAPVAFTAFLVVYAVDRWFLLRHRRTSPGRAFLQVIAALAFLPLLWPSNAARYRESRWQQGSASETTLRLLGHAAPEVRAAACELLALRPLPPEGTAVSQRVLELISSDRSEGVRKLCRVAASRWAWFPQTPAP